MLKKDTKLQPHQKRVLERLSKGNSLLLYHGLGSGKTLSSISATEEGDDVVVPASLRPNYATQLKQFATGKRNIMSYVAASKGGLKGGDTLVVDEVQRLGNSGSKRTQKLIEGAPKYKKRILLSGTPITNNPYEIAPIIRMLDPGNKDVPLDAAAFKNKFIEEKVTTPGLMDRLFYGMKPGVEVKLKNIDVLRRAVQGKVDYHTPDTTNYPKRQDKTVEVTMSDDQAAVYSTVTSKANPLIAAKVRAGFPLSKKELTQINSFMVAARMVSNTTKPYGGEGVSNKFKRAVSDFKKDLKKNPKHKGITYSNYLEGGVSEYAKLLEKAKIPHAIFSGGISDKERKSIVDSYNTGKIKNILVTKAGSEGLDLKGTRSIQILEPHWNDARVEQVIGRGIRFKSHDHLPKKDRKVNVVKYHSVLPKSAWQRFWSKKPDTSADTYLHELSAKKERLNNQLLDMLKREGMSKKAGVDMFEYSYEKGAAAAQQIIGRGLLGAGIGGAAGAGVGGATDIGAGEGALGGAIAGAAASVPIGKSINKRRLRRSYDRTYDRFIKKLVKDPSLKAWEKSRDELEKQIEKTTNEWALPKYKKLLKEKEDIIRNRRLDLDVEAINEDKKHVLSRIL